MYAILTAVKMMSSSSSFSFSSLLRAYSKQYASNILVVNSLSAYGCRKLNKKFMSMKALNLWKMHSCNAIDMHVSGNASNLELQKTYDTCNGQRCSLVLLNTL